MADEYYSIVIDDSSDDDVCELSDDSWSLEQDQDILIATSDSDEVAVSSETDDDIFGTLNIDDTGGERQRMSESLLTGIGHSDYSLLQEVYVAGQDNETNDSVDSMEQDGIDFGTSAIPVSEISLQETSEWLEPNELLVAVKTKMIKEPPRLAESGTLGTSTMLPCEWSTPLVPFIIGRLSSPVPDVTDKLKTHDLVSKGHRGHTILTEKPRQRKLIQKPTYTISSPQIHASSLMAMVISCKLHQASCCRPKNTPCIIDHHLEDVVLCTAAIYKDIMKDIQEMNSWPYVHKFLNTESFNYTSQVFLRAVYSRQTNRLSKCEHQDITLIYPETIVPTECFILSTAMRECFSQPTRGLVQVTEFSLVIRCHGPRSSKYFSYNVDPLPQRMGIVCICKADQTPQPCTCAQQYVETLVRLSTDEGNSQSIADCHPLASFHVTTLPQSTSPIAYTLFVLIDELTKGKQAHVKIDKTMTGNNVTLKVGSFEHKAAFISKTIKQSCCDQPSLFATIHLSRVLLKTAGDVVNSVAQMCATVLFMMRHGNPDRSHEYDKKYNDIVKQITDFFPQITIKTIPSTAQGNTKPTACSNCGRVKAFIKKGYASVLVCDNCKTDSLKERFSTKLTISKQNYQGSRKNKPYART